MPQKTDTLPHDLGALLLRLTIGGLMLFHGVDKMAHGIGWLGPALAGKGLPEFLQYGVYLGEVVAPVLLILGVVPRISAFLIASTMVVAVYTAHSTELFALGDHGEYALELNVLYLAGAIAAALIGPGRFAIPVKGRLRDF
ncbi:MAG: GntR family transcriptional regulator [Deltaproteobacteria bacterium]|nr:MAG: GntR family transcriptional regulator [Deltaproteobacteria bacterium]